MIYLLIPISLIFLVKWKLAEHEINRLRGILNEYHIKVKKLDKVNNTLNKIIARLR